MKLTEIKKNTFVIDFRTRKDLLETLLRFQEYYESPEFKDKVFSLKEYKKWYKKSRNSLTFTYYSDWSGCNVPSYVFDFFRSGKMNPLSKKEQELLNILPKNGKYYIIGVFNGGREDIVEHEICHSLFYSNMEYKEEVLLMLKEYDKELDTIKKHVLNLGYHESVLMDEVHAYASANYLDLKKKGVFCPEELNIKLQELLSRHN